MISIHNHGGKFGGGLKPGNINVLKDLKMDFPLEKKTPVIAWRTSPNYSCYDICGNYVLSSYYGDVVKLYRLEPNNAGGGMTNVVTHTPPAGKPYSKFALCKEYYALVNIDVSPFEITTRNLAGNVINSKNFTSAIIDIQSDGEYIYVLKADYSLEKYDSSLNNPVATMTKPVDLTAVNQSFRILIVPKGTYHDYFYLCYQTTNYFAVSKILKTTMERVAINNTTLPRDRGTHVMGIDFEKGNVFVAQCNANPAVSISVLDSNLANAWNSGTFDFNTGSASYISSIIVGKDDVYYIYKAQNGSYGYLVHARQNRNTLTIRSVNSTNNIITSLNISALHIALDIDGNKILKPSALHDTGSGGGHQEINIGFYKI